MDKQNHIFNSLPINNESKDNNNNLINIITNINNIKEKRKEYDFIIINKKNKKILLNNTHSIKYKRDCFMFYILFKNYESNDYKRKRKNLINEFK